MCDICMFGTAFMHGMLCFVMMQAVHKRMQLEVSRLKWKHAQEIAEVQHNAG